MENSTLDNQFVDAIVTGNLSNLRYFISLGIDIQMNNNWAIRMACKKYNLHLIKFLIGKGADVNENGGFALRWIFENCPFSIIIYLNKFK